MLEQRQLLAAVATDMSDYAPGQTAHIFASSFQPGETVQFQVLHNDGTPNTGNGHLPWNVADGGAADLDGKVDGNIETTWYVDPDDSNLSSFNLTATGLDSHLIATTTFTDVGSSLSQFANLPTTQYQTGSLNGSNSAYVEGNSIPFRYLVSDLREGAAVVLDIIYQFQSSAAGPRTYDYLTGDAASESITDMERFGPNNASKPSGFGLTSSTNLVTAAIPDDPSITTDTGGNFRVASNVPVTIVSVSAPAISSSSDEKHIIMVIQLGNDGDATPNENIVDLGVFWGGHLARDTDYAGTNNGASDAPGASFHMRTEGFQDVNGNNMKDSGEDNLGGGDRSIQGGVVVHTSLAWEKRRADTNLLQGGATFTITANPFTGSGSLIVVDDTDGVTSAGDIDHDPDPGQILLEDIQFGTYTITETTAPAGFFIDADPTRLQSVTSAAPTAVVGTQGVNDAGITDESDFHNTSFAPAIDIEKLVNGQDADTATGPILAVGSTATFTYQVKNTGNVPLSNVVVVDDNGTPGVPGDDFNPTFTGGDTNNNSLLDPTETWTYSASHVVTAGQYTNIGLVIGQTSVGQAVTDSDPANHFGAAPAIEIEKLVNGQDADAATGPILAVGSTATFTYQVKNTGNVPLSNVVVVDDNGTPGVPGDDFNPTFTGGDANSNSLLDLNETWTYSANHVVTAGQYTNIGKVTGQSSIGQTVTDTDPANHFGAAPAIDIEKLVNGQDADATTGPVLAVGSTATFTYQVTNTGNVPLSSVVVVDDNGTPGAPGDDFNPTFTGGDVNNNSLLDLNETWTYSANHVVTAGQYTNIGKVTGQSSIGQTVTDTDPANHFGAAPAIDIEKLVNSQDADAATGPVLAVGSTATFTYQVTNTGNVALSSVVVVDDNGTPGVLGDDFNPTFTGGDVNNNSLLDLNETWTYSANHTVTAGQYTNIGKVTGQSSIGQSATDTDPANHFGAAPAIDIEKFVNGQDADAATGPILQVGSTATFTYQVTNTGNMVLSNVIVVDDNGTPSVPGDDFNPAFIGGDANNNSLLDLNETWTYSASRVVTAGQYTNTGEITGQSSIGQTVSDTDPANHFGAAPAIDIEKFVNGQDADAASGPILAVGSTATFTYQVTNTGNVPLSNVVVVDDNGTLGLPGDDFNPTFTGGDVNNNSLLDLNETWTYTANHTVTAGQYTNIGKVTGQSSIGQSVTDIDPANHFGAAPGIDIEKLVNGQDADAATGPLLTVGSTATFTYQVTNTGNVALSNVVVVDDNGTPGVAGDDFNPTFTGGDVNNNSRLDLNETWTYSANHIVTAGQYTNIGKVTGQSSIGQSATDTDPANHFGATPSIGINKVTVDGASSGDGLTILSGESNSWHYTVTNTGNVALSGVMVTDNQAGVTPAYQSGDVNNNSLLDLTETWLFTAAGTAVTGNYSNTGTTHGSFTDSAQQTSKVMASDPSSYFGATPQIAINKVTIDGANVGDGITVDVGDSISWRYTVTNTGNVALSGVTVNDNQSGVTPGYQSGDINNNGFLDLTETWTFTAVGVAIAGNYNNIGTAKGSFTDTAGHSRTATAADASSYVGECEIIVIGPDKQNTATSLVIVVNKKTGQIESQFYAYEPNFNGGVRLTTGDMDGDGVDEIITAPGRGRAPEIRVFKQDGTELTQFRTMAYATSFSGGVDVAVGDVNGDGNNDIVTVPTYGPTQVRVFFNNYNPGNPAADPIHNSPDKQFAVFSNKFQGGADVILADVGTFSNGATVSATTPDGKSEIVVGNGPGMRSTIYVYDVTSTPTVVDTILPFDNKFKGGITLDAARINADLIPDFVVSAGNGGKSAIEIWSGLTNDGPDVRLSAFNAFTGAKTVNAPVHAVAMDTNDDGIAETIVAVQGTDGATGEIRSFSPSGALQSKLTGFNKSWNIAKLRCHEPMVPAVDAVFAQLGA
jgi:hypothetical protein